MTSCANCGKVEKCSRASAWKDNCDDYTRKTNFQRITESVESLAEFVWQDRVEQSDWWYEQCGHTVEEVLEWLKQESTE